MFIFNDVVRFISVIVNRLTVPDFRLARRFVTVGSVSGGRWFIAASGICSVGV
ncbi:hypothetical protein Hanom_Chr09g00778401 [Helianthus anomalus]